MSAYPIRAVFMPLEPETAATGNASEPQQEGSKASHNTESSDISSESSEPRTANAVREPRPQVLISVSKRHFKHAVDRNRVKRQLREAYRLNRHLLLKHLPSGTRLVVAFIWLSPEHFESQAIHAKMQKLLLRIGESLREG